MSSLLELILSLGDGLDMSVENAVLIVASVACLIPAAKDVRLGAIFLFIMSGVQAVIWYSVGGEWFAAVVTMLIGFVLMIFLLYAQKTGASVA